MVDGPNVTYQPAVAYQGGQVNTPQQAPKDGYTQPLKAALAGSQDRDDSKRSATGSGDTRGTVLDVTA